MILSKVVADKHEIDHTTLGKSLHNNFIFPTQELPEWGTAVPLTMQQENIVIPTHTVLETNAE